MSCGYVTTEVKLKERKGAGVGGGAGGADAGSKRKMQIVYISQFQRCSAWERMQLHEVGANPLNNFSKPNIQRER